MIETLSKFIAVANYVTRQPVIITVIINGTTTTTNTINANMERYTRLCEKCVEKFWQILYLLFCKRFGWAQLAQQILS